MQIELSCVKVKTVNEDTSKPSKNHTDEQNAVEDALVDKDDQLFHRFECCSCGYIYDPSEGIKKMNISPGTAFFQLDRATFRCPVCRLGIEYYKDIGPASKPSGFEENLTYGFGFNKLPASQKNVLIFGAFAFAAACFLSLYSLH